MTIGNDHLKFGTYSMCVVTRAKARAKAWAMAKARARAKAKAKACQWLNPLANHGQCNGPTCCPAMASHGWPTAFGLRKPMSQPSGQP